MKRKIEIYYDELNNFYWDKEKERPIRKIVLDLLKRKDDLDVSCVSIAKKVDVYYDEFGDYYWDLFGTKSISQSELDALEKNNAISTKHFIGYNNYTDDDLLEDINYINEGKVKTYNNSRYYNEVVNPLYKDETIIRLIDANSQPGLICENITLDNVEDEQFAPSYYYLFRIVAFNNWRNKILNMQENKVSFKPYYLKELYQTLKEMKPVKTNQDLINAYEILNNNHKLKVACKHYLFNRNDSNGYKRMDSGDFNQYDNEDDYFEFNLYLNIAKQYRHAFATLLLQKYTSELNIPFRFEIDENDNSHEGNIIISCHKETLKQNIDLIENIIDEHPEFLNAIKNPPVLTGVLHGFIGIASNPKKYCEDQDAFEYEHTKNMKKTIRNSTAYWIGENINQMIRYKGQDMTIGEYFANVATIVKIKELRKSNKYDMGLIESQDLYDHIFNAIDKNLERVLLDFASGMPYSSSVYTFIDEHIIKMDADFFTSVINRIAPTIVRNDSNYLDKIKNDLLKCTKKNKNIDYEKFCFNYDTKYELEEYDNLLNYEEERRYTR